MLLLHCYALRKFYVADGPYARDQMRSMHSILSLWTSKRMLATYMGSICDNKLEIRIAGSSCRPQIYYRLSFSESARKMCDEVLTLVLNV